MICKFVLWIKSPALGDYWLKYSSADSKKALNAELKWREANGYEAMIMSRGQRPT